MKNSNPTELASVDSGLCTTNLQAGKNVVQRPDDHRSKLGGACYASDNNSVPPQFTANPKLNRYNALRYPVFWD